MTGLLCSSNAKNNEEYREVIKKRMNRFLMLGTAGVITFIIGMLAEYQWNMSIKISEHMLGVYTGVGAGMTGASIILYIKNKLLLGNEEKLKESRLTNTDERIQLISSAAFRRANIVLLIALYGVGLIGGLFYPVLMQVLFGLVSLFLLSYVISYKMIERKM